VEEIIMATTQTKDDTPPAQHASKPGAPRDGDVSHSDGPGEGDSSATKEAPDGDEERPETD